MDVMIWPPENPVKAEINLPPSKSESNRLVIIRAMTPGVDPRSAGLSDCDDTRAILEGIAAADGTRVDVGPAGTAMRFLTAYYAATPGKRVTLDGNERMRQRPIGPLVEALRQCGASVEYAGAEGFPPLRIEGRRLTGGEIEIDATVSSQFISALMMVAPVMERGITLTLKGRAISRPYVEMTAGLMRMAGAEVESGSDCVRVAPGRYRPFDYEAEGDWSAASYWFEIAVLSARSITLKPLYDRSLQGDRRVETLMRATGLTMRRTDEDSVMPTPTIYAEPQIVADLSNTPDLAQTMAVTCCLAGIRFLFTGLESLTIKETDRLAALQSELHKLGYQVMIHKPGMLEWQGTERDTDECPAPIETYGDHRMAMAFAPAAIFHPGLRIRGAECVSKSYPRFWADMEAAGFTINYID